MRRTRFDRARKTDLLPGQIIQDRAAALYKLGVERSIFIDDRFRNSPVHIVSGVGVGLTVVAGWAVTGLAYDDMATRPVPPIY